MGGAEAPVRAPSAGRRCATARASRGFTLAEALVALSILALVALLAWRATAAMTDNEARLAAESARWQHLDAVLSRVEADLRAAVPRRARHGRAIEAAWSMAPEDTAGNTLLIFTRAGPDAVDEPGIGGQRIGYRWRSGRIEALYWPHIDNDNATLPATYALADGVAGFRIEAIASNLRTTDQWPLPGSAEIPRGVRIQLLLADGTAVERWLALQ